LTKIPVHHLNNWADFGLDMGHTSYPGAREMLESFEAHRDDCFSFLLIETGEGAMDVDFVTVDLPEAHIYYLVPGQIHHNIKTNDSNTWFLSVNPSLVAKPYRQVFEGNLLLQQPIKLDTHAFAQFQNIINILNAQFKGENSSPLYKQLVHSLLDSLLGMYAKIYQREDLSEKKTSRLYQITQQFKKLLMEKIKLEKRPAFYAGELNISETYLNEAVKEITGFTATYWLMNEIMVEAKRLLIYSPLTVKEIAYDLGYEDHVYFSKLFKKVSRSTPTDFRAGYLR
jgi:AraC family transcriptional regulator, transcriptional activator of pobA